MTLTFPKKVVNPKTSKVQVNPNQPVNPSNAIALTTPKDQSTTPPKQALEATTGSPNPSHHSTATRPTEVSQKIANRQQTPYFPRKQRSKTNCHSGPENSIDQPNQLEVDQQKQKHLEQQQPQHHDQEQQQQEASGIVPFVFQGQGRPKLKAVHRLHSADHPPEFSTSAAVLQARFLLNQRPQSTKTARKQKPVQGDTKLEKFKLLQVNDLSATQMKADDTAQNNECSLTVTHSIAPWAVVCDKMPDQGFPNTSSVKETRKGKTAHREGHGFFSKIFGRKTSAEGNLTKHQQKAKKESLEFEKLAIGMQALKISSATSIHQNEIKQGKADCLTSAEATLSEAEQQPLPDSDSSTADSDSSAELEPPSCLETWEIATDVVEKALSLLPVPTAGRYMVPESPFEPEFVQTLVADALEARRGLQRIKEDQKLMEKFRDSLLKFFEDKDISDVIPPCNHPPGTNQCNLQPVIQPLLDILRQVLQEPKIADVSPKVTNVPLTKASKKQLDFLQPLPRKKLKIKKRLKTGQAPTQLLVRFCHACGDTKQPDGRKLMSCGRCKDVMYCSKECQSVDWITHKFTCRGGDRRSYCKHHGT